MTRFVRRTLAPLLTGALAGGMLVSVAAGVDVFPVGGVLAQATGEPTTTETTVPTDQLDLDDLVAELTKFDADSVFVDLDPAGDFPGIYEYGNQTAVENVASELKLVVPGFDDPDGKGPIVSERDAARRFLPDERCNGLLALPIRKQVTRPLRARILRPDEELIAQVEAFLDNSDPPPGVAPISALPPEVVIDPIQTPHVPPLESVVEIGRVTVSVLDLDLIRVRPPALLAELAAGDAPLSNLVGAGAPADAYATPEFFAAAWTSCLVEAAEEGTVPVAQSLAGKPVVALKRDQEPDVPVNATTPDIDTVTWLEDGLEVRVEASFQDVDDNLPINDAIDLDTRTWLEHYANGVEPAVEVASQIVARAADEFDLLEREAFAPIGGFEYGEPIAGTQERVGSTVRQEEEAFRSLLAEEAGAAAAPGSPAPVAEEFEGAAGRVQRASARSVLPTGADLTNTRRRFQEPPNPFVVGPVGAVQMVAWDPEFLNSDAFRDGWTRGILDASDVGASLDALVESGEFSAERAAELRGLGVVDLMVSKSEGVYRTDYLLPCYSVTVSSLTRDRDLDIANRALAAQKARRDEVFGTAAGASIGVGPAPADEGDEFSPLLEDLERRDYGLASLKGRNQRLGEREDEARARRAQEDARRVAFCSSSNLQAHFSGEPVEDADLNGVADRLPQNEAAKLDDAASENSNVEAGQ